jgi:hypothetical protein
MDKENVAPTYSGIFFSLKKKEILPYVATWMKLEGFRQSELSQAQKHNLFSSFFSQYYLQSCEARLHSQVPLKSHPIFTTC